uniref:Methionine adenosyltransferase 2 subunit beta n=1 Tax=Mandrillus leucophaeus TaxID=9568 RepID=A0A2K5YQ95_MANLE
MVGREKELSIHFVPRSCRLVEEEVNIPNGRVLVTGATGLLGRAVHKEFQQNNWHAVGCGFRRARPKFDQVNLQMLPLNLMWMKQLLLGHFSSTLAQIMYLMEKIHLTERKTYQLP